MTTEEIIQSMKTNLKNAYDNVESKGGKLESKNKLKIPYGFNRDGVVATLNKDGTLNLDGTATADIHFEFSKTYTSNNDKIVLEILDGITSNNIQFAYMQSNWETSKIITSNMAVKKNSVNLNNNITYSNCRITLTKGTSYINCKIGIMICSQDEDNTYEPYNKPKNLQNLSSAIESIPSKWQPEPDWWDIDKILEEDTEEYQSKIIFLLNDTWDTAEFVSRTASFLAEKIKTSDGIVYNSSDYSNGTYITHIWDKSKDKDCLLGYKTRYIIYYLSSDNIQFSATIPFKHKVENNYENGTLYIIADTPSLVCYNTAEVGWWGANNSIQKIKNNGGKIYAERFGGITNCYNINGKYQLYIKTNNTRQVFQSCTNLDEAELIYEVNALDMFNNFYNCNKIKSIKSNVNTSAVKNFSNSFANCWSLINLDMDLNFNSATNISGVFNKCYNLRNIKSISNIKINNLNFSTCYSLTHETLIKILNALYDYSTSENTYTLALGTANLSKLTDEEIAIATNKGWNVS